MTEKMKGASRSQPVVDGARSPPPPSAEPSGAHGDQYPRDAPHETPEFLLSYAQDLARHCAEKFRHTAWGLSPDWAPFDDLGGVLTQLDNMLSAMSVTAQPEAFTPLRQGPGRPLSAEQRGAICNALINLVGPESDDEHRAIQQAQRAIEAAVEGDQHPWREVQ